ncbi:MAG: enoyl-CoA hydratase-related protein [Bacteroidota bacterium]
MAYKNLLIEVENSICKVTINRQEKLNALTSEIIRELHDALFEASKMNDVRVIILTGAGSKAFVAGADIAEFSDFNSSEGAAFSAEGHKLLFNFIENLNKPVIAAVNGFALGGGLELAMSCHVRVASNNAKMGLPEVSLGVIPGYGGTQRLAQLVGKGKAFEMILSGDFINADDAFRYNLVNYVVAPEDLMKKCEEIAGKMISKSSTALASAIKAVNASYKNGVNGFDVEIIEFGRLFETEDFKEGTTAFLEKRKPDFKGQPTLTATA